MPDAPLRVLVVGGGVAGIEALLGLHALAHERVRLAVLAAEPGLVNRPSSVAQPFGGARPRSLDVGAIASRVGARLRSGRLAAVDPQRHEAHTADGSALGYDALVVAVGAVAQDALPGAVLFRGPPDVARIRELLADIHLGRVRRVAFALPAGATWPLPLYELALQTAARARTLGVSGLHIVLATPEERPLALFGPAASDAVSALLDEAGIEVVTSVHPAAVEDGGLRLVPGRQLAADRVVALPRLRGPALPGLPSDRDGFVPVDPYGAVPGAADVFAAGDVTSFPVKQGGLAAQQADAVAETLAARAGAPVDPSPFKPVLRGMLLTGRARAFLRAGIAGGQDEASTISDLPLWWPPTKVVGHHLARYLVDASEAAPQDVPDDPAAVPVEAAIER